MSVLRRIPEPLPLALLLLVPLVLGFDTYGIYLASLMAVYAMTALGVTILLGVARQFHLGQAAFLAIGGYAAGVVSERWTTSLLAEVAIAVVLGVGLGAVVGAATLRLKGIYFALSTLALVLLTQNLATNLRDLTHGTIGFVAIPPSTLFGIEFVDTSLYLLVAGVLLVKAAVVMNAQRSTYWTALKLIGDRDHLASAVGVDVYRYRLTLFMIVAGGAAVAGVLYAHLVGFISPETFGLTITIAILLMAVLGGLGSLWGAVVGAVVLVEIPEVLAGIRTRTDLVYGAILLACILLFPKGLVPFLSERFGRRRPEPSVAPATFTGLRFDGATLDVEDVHCSFGGVHALQGASLSARPGAIEGLIGPNGSGKTTLLNCVSGLTVPQRGSVTLGGESLSGAPAHRVARAGLARTFQTPQVVLSLTGLENAAVGWHQRRSSGVWSVLLGLPAARRERRAQIESAEALCAAFSLSGEYGRPAAELSTGERRFVELARALGSQPRLLFLDEPATGLTAGERVRLRAILDALKAAGLTIVVIDHDMEFLFGVADHVTVLEGRRNIAAGTPDEVRRDPAVIEAYFGSDTYAAGRN